MKKGDLVKLIEENEEVPLSYGLEGTVLEIDLKTQEAHVHFGDMGSFFLPFYSLRKTKGRDNFNDRDRIKEEYDEWVDRVSSACDWKTHFTKEEIQEKYSEIALKYALEIIESSLEMSCVDSQRMLRDKRQEIKNILTQDGSYTEN